MTATITEKPLHSSVGSDISMSFEDVRDALALLGLASMAEDYTTAEVVDTEDLWIGTWAKDTRYVAVCVNAPWSSQDRVTVDVYAAVAQGCMPTADLSHELALATWRSDEGGPTVLDLDGGTVAVGWSARLAPSQVTFSTLIDAVQTAIEGMGETAAALGVGLVPAHGGTVGGSEDDDALALLLRGALTVR